MANVQLCHYRTMNTLLSKQCWWRTIIIRIADKLSNSFISTVIVIPYVYFLFCWLLLHRFNVHVLQMHGIENRCKTYKNSLFKQRSQKKNMFSSKRHLGVTFTSVWIIKQNWLNLISIVWLNCDHRLEINSSSFYKIITTICIEISIEFSICISCAIFQQIIRIFPLAELIENKQYEHVNEMNEFDQSKYVFIC